MDFGSVHFARFFVSNFALNALVHVFGHAFIETKYFVKIIGKVRKTNHIIVKNGNVSRRLVSHVNVMPLVGKANKRAAHRNNVIVGVRTENDNFFRKSRTLLRTVLVFVVRFATRPTRNGVSELAKNFNIDVVSGIVFSHQIAHAVFSVVVVGEFKDGFFLFLTEPNDGTFDEFLVVPIAIAHEPRGLYSGQMSRRSIVQNDECVRVFLDVSRWY